MVYKEVVNVVLKASIMKKCSDLENFPLFFLTVENN